MCAAAAACPSNGEVITDDALVAMINSNEGGSENEVTRAELNGALGSTMRGRTTRDSEGRYWSKAYMYKGELRRQYYIPEMRARVKALQTFPDGVDPPFESVDLFLGSSPARERKPGVVLRKSGSGRGKRPTSARPTTGSTPGKTKGSAREEPVDTAALLCPTSKESLRDNIGAMSETAVRELAAELLKERENLAEKGAAFHVAREKFERKQSWALRAVHDGSVVELAATKRDLESERALVGNLEAELASVDISEIQGVSVATKTLLEVTRGIKSLSLRQHVLAEFASRLTDKEKAGLVLKIAPPEPDLAVVTRLGAELDAYKNREGANSAETFDKVFDEHGLPSRAESVEAQFKRLQTPFGKPNEEDSLLSKVLTLFAISSFFDEKTRRADVANKEGRSWRANHDKVKPGETGGVPGKDGVFYRKAPLKSGSELGGWVLERQRRTKTLALVLAGIIVSSHTGGRQTTPMMMMVSLMIVWIGGLTQSVAVFATRAFRITGKTLVDKWTDTIATRYRSTVHAVILKAMVTYGTTFIFITDNYALLQWAAHKQHKAKFTSISDTMSLIGFVVPRDPRHGYNPRTDSTRPPAMPKNFDQARIISFFAENARFFDAGTHHMTPEVYSAKWITRDALPDDGSAGYASLKDFSALPSLAAKSSSLKDLLGVVLVVLFELMQNIGLTGHDLFLLVDPEPYLLLDTAARLYWDQVWMVFVLLSVFHLQKHGMEDFFTNPNDFKNLFGPMLVTVMDYRAAHFRSLLNKHVRGFNVPTEDDEDEDAVNVDQNENELSEMMNNLDPREARDEEVNLDATGAEIAEDLADELAAAGRETPADANVPDTPPQNAGTLPPLGGSSHSAKKGSKINFGRLRYFLLLLWAASREARPRIVKEASAFYFEKHGVAAPGEMAAIDWACRTSSMFQYLWNAIYNELDMWVSPFIAWDEGDSLPVYTFLPLYCTYFIFYVNPKTWRSSRIVPWLLSHWHATDYRLVHRLDLLRTAARSCKHIQDVFIEHYNSVMARLVPTNAAIEEKHIVKASCVVTARWQLRDATATMFGTKRSTPMTELQQDLARIESAAFRPTVLAMLKWVVGLFVAELALMRVGRPTACEVERKATVGLAWIPAMVANYEGRLSRAKESTAKTADERRAADDAAREKYEEYKLRLSAEKVLTMRTEELKTIMKEIKYPGRSKLRVLDGSLKRAVFRAFDLRDVAAQQHWVPPQGAPAPA